MMTLLKGTFVGIGAFAVTVSASTVAALFIMTNFPQVAVRIFPMQQMDLQWGDVYYLDFPLWPIIILGLMAFTIAFGWTLRRSHERGASQP